ncbi:MAG: hypothetical protein M1838_002842 [Thelocarpon superellum]|nr:MAG: hypothetical protein M1838_002842 [Thelocarpon superellum]
MAAPASVSMKKIDGVYAMNRTISDDPDPILALQGISWLVRKAIAIAPVSLVMKQYDDPTTGVTHLDTEQRGVAGIKGWVEARTLDFQEREADNGLFGKVRSQSRWVKVGEIEDDFLKEGWLVTDDDAPLTEGGDKAGPGDLLHSHVVSLQADWVAEQIWGFSEVDGKRYHTRLVVVSTPKERVQAKLVYDYTGES